MSGVNGPSLNYLQSILTLSVNDEPVHFNKIETKGTLVSGLCRAPFTPDSRFELFWKSDLKGLGKVWCMNYELDVMDDKSQAGSCLGDCESAHQTGVLTLRVTLCPSGKLVPEGETFCTFFITLSSTTPVEFDAMKTPFVAEVANDSNMTLLGKKGKGKGKGKAGKVEKGGNKPDKGKGKGKASPKKAGKVAGSTAFS